jgi:RNA polymerase-binding transcription factor DksA
MTMPQPAKSNGVPAATLSQLQAELETALRSYETRLEETPEPDDISMAVHRRSEEAHAEIVAALSRIEDGSFGTCQTCFGPISLDRLEAMPHTRFCMTCVRRNDQIRA